MERAHALAVAAVLVAAGFLGWIASRASRTAVAPVTPVESPDGDAPHDHASDPASRPGSRPGEASLPRSWSAPPPQGDAVRASEPGTLRGTVVDLEGSPRAKVRLGFVGFSAERGAPLAESTSGPLGEFRFEVPGPREGSVQVLDADLVGVLVPRLYGGVPEHELMELTVVVAERRTLQGRVQDQDGRPVAGASVSMQGGVDLRARIARNFDRCEAKSVTATSTDDGSFTLEDAYAIPEAKLHAAKEGFLGMPSDVPQAARGIVLVLQHLQAGEILRGTVVDGEGKAVQNAEVALGNLRACCDANGAFSLDLGAVHTLAPLDRAVLIAFGPAPSLGRVEPHSPDWRKRASWPADLVVRLGNRLPEITGHVEDADGNRVELFESLLLDVKEPGLLPQLEAYRDDITFKTLSGLIDDPTGFRLTCPGEGSYRIRIRVQRQLRVHVSEPIRAGTRGAVIRLPREDAWPALRLHVVDPRGAPVVGADAVAQASAAAGDGGNPWRTEFLRTDAQGVLEVPALARGAELLLVKATELADFETHEIADLVRSATTRIVVPRACQARVELVDPREDADSVAFEDAVRHPLQPVVTSGNARFGSPTVGLQAGRSWVFTISEGAVTAHLKKGGKLLRTTTVALVPGPVNVLRL